MRNEGMKHHNLHLKSQTVLLVDDDLAYCRALSRALSKQGFSVWTASTKTEALSAGTSIAFDFAMVDLHLDRENGMDVIEFLTRNSPKTKSILVSGYVTPSLAVQAIRLGASDCLAKPADLNVLLNALLDPKDSDGFFDLSMALEPADVRMGHVLARWEKNHRNLSKTARDLSMHRRTLQRILRREGITSPDQDGFERPSRFTELRRLLTAWRKSLPA